METQECQQDMNKDGVLHFYEPEQIAAVSPCTLLLDVFPKQLARSLALELLDQSKSWTSNTFRLFDRTVTSPHMTSKRSMATSRTMGRD